MGGNYVPFYRTVHSSLSKLKIWNKTEMVVYKDYEVPEYSWEIWQEKNLPFSKSEAASVIQILCLKCFIQGNSNSESLLLMQNG